MLLSKHPPVDGKNVACHHCGSRARQEENRTRDVIYLREPAEGRQLLELGDKTRLPGERGDERRPHRAGSNGIHSDPARGPHSIAHDRVMFTTAPLVAW